MSIHRKLFMNTREVAEATGMSPYHINRLARTGVIPVVKAGHKMRLYDPDAVKEAIFKLGNRGTRNATR